MSSPDRRSGQAKSRIVIDVEKVRSDRKRRHLGRFPRAKKILAIVAVSLLVVLAGGYLWWQNYKTGPSYALALLVDAAQRDDVRAVEELIDSDKIAEGFIPQVTAKLIEGVGAARMEPIRRQIEGAMPQLLPRVRETMRDEMAKHVKMVSGTGESKPFILVALSMPYFASVTRDGETARVSVDIKERPIELTMQRTADARWKVVHVKDDAVASDIAVRLASSLPSTGAPVQNEARPPKAAPRQRPAARPSVAAPVSDQGATND
jgi:hypothetical protein